MVVDSSALIAVLFREPQADWVAEQLTAHAHRLRMSTVNLTEVLIRFEDRYPARIQAFVESLNDSSIRFIPPDVEQACVAGSARLRFPLNLGDCFAYALARIDNVPILTLDRDFRGLDCPVLMPPDV